MVNEGIISKESTEVIRDEIDWLVDRCFCYQGQHGIYCLECTLTVEDAYVHYPNLFTPLRLTILESVAEKLCKSAESFTKLSADGKEKNAKTKNAIQLNNLLEIQKKSYDWFITEGIEEVFESNMLLQF